MKTGSQRHQKNKDPNKNTNLWYKDPANNIQKKNKILSAIFTERDYFIKTDLVCFPPCWFKLYFNIQPG